MPSNWLNRQNYYLNILYFSHLIGRAGVSADEAEWTFLRINRSQLGR